MFTRALDFLRMLRSKKRESPNLFEIPISVSVSPKIKMSACERPENSSKERRILREKKERWGEAKARKTHD